MISGQQSQPPALTETISGVYKDPRRISPLVLPFVFGDKVFVIILTDFFHY